MTVPPISGAVMKAEETGLGIFLFKRLSFPFYLCIKFWFLK